MRVRGGEVESRLKKSVLRGQRSRTTQRSDLEPVTVQSVAAKDSQNLRKYLGSCFPNTGIL